MGLIIAIKIYLPAWLILQVTEPEQGIISIILKALQQIVEQDLKGVLTGVVITLWYIYRYSGFRKRLEEFEDKIDTISRRQRIIIEALRKLSKNEITDSEDS